MRNTLPLQHKLSAYRARVFPIDAAPETIPPRLRQTIHTALRLSGAFVDAVAGMLEANRTLCITLLIALYTPLVCMQAHAHLLVNDEIYTLRIAQAPTLRQMLWMAHEIDLHPPLHYLLERGALLLPLPLWLAARLPNLLAGLVVTLVLFHLTARRLGNLLGLVSILIFWSSSALDAAWQNRPYMLWMAFLSLLLFSWKRYTRLGRSRLYLAGIVASASCMIANHLFGLACLLPFALAEFARYRHRHKTDWPLWTALSIPALLGLALCGSTAYYQMHHLAMNSFISQHLPSAGLAWGMYSSFVADFLAVLLACLLIGAYLPTTRKTEHTRTQRLSLSEGTLLIGLLLLPLLLLALGAVAHVQFWWRYGFCSVLAIALLVPWCLYRRVRALSTVTALLALFLIGRTIGSMVCDTPTPGSRSAAYTQTGRTPITLARLDASLPIVAANPMTFNELSFREPLSIASRTYYLLDRAAALRYSGYTLFENEDKIHTLLHLPSQTAQFTAFTSTHTCFYLIASYNNPENWLPRALADRGANLNYLGKFVSTYDDDDLYLVTMNPPFTTTADNRMTPAHELRATKNQAPGASFIAHLR